MQMTPHETYYEKVKERAHERMGRIVGKQIDGTDEMRDALAKVLKLGTPTEAAEAIEAFVDARMANHELHEHENA